jgi:two-component system sensor histidine kinase/response regulator
MGREEDESSYPAASVLVVDDRAANLAAVEAVLESLGQRIVLARSGAEALERARAEAFAVILMDVHMPMLDGFATVERLRREDPTCDTPILFMSAVYDDSAHARRGYELGGVDYVSKPTDPELLRAKVASFVSLFRRGRELRRRAELLKERTEAAERLERANRLKDTYLAIIGHDLRTPLEVIAVVAEKLRRSASPEDCRSLADRLDRAVKRAEVIVGEVLDFTRGELDGGIPLTRTETDFGDAARVVVHEQVMLHPDRKIVLDLDGELRGRWDLQRIEQALGNLISNAVDHGSGAISVKVKGATGGVEVAVHNDGGVIVPADLPRIFEPFHRSTCKNGGLGLGLYIVRQIAYAHGGTIEVRSKEGEGTTFTSWWPSA